MDLWRLYRRAHGPGVDGAGGLYAAGRWHELGSRVVYFGASPAIVVLEKLAHIDPAALPSDLILAHYAGDVGVEEVSAKDVNLQDATETRARGALFLQQGKVCVLRVPSIVVPEENNLVLNPLHPDAQKIVLVHARPFSFDGRLL